ncbi:hypothetical protein [Aliiroseovarius subalbicans]|uniref:hypothetical protein n=1 Tax=Aliiroseovarius subalbicans TaxID=2925840 RepID=UPI001F572172|nr:hypothetical protein [Aliiroseovarius subalbicans]MCI2399964.1 hypothetical protein [Aliiroseovarius subalbicans]
MKKFLLASAITLTATSAFAGALSDPIVEADVIVEEAAGSSTDGSWLVPVMFLILLLSTMGNNGPQG